MSYKDTFYQTLVMELNFENQDFARQTRIWRNNFTESQFAAEMAIE